MYRGTENFGKTLLGWNREGTIDFLKDKADKCRESQPEIAEELEEWIGILQDPERNGD